jgi:hypothetical protein
MSLNTHEKKALGFLLHHLLMGTVGGFFFGVLLLWQDVGNLRTLAMNSDHTALYVGMLFFGLFITFGSVGMGIGIMSLGDDRN